MGQGRKEMSLPPAVEISVNVQKAAEISLAHFYSRGDLVFIKILLKIEIQFCVKMYMEHFPALPSSSSFPVPHLC